MKRPSVSLTTHNNPKKHTKEDQVSASTQHKPLCIKPTTYYDSQILIDVPVTFAIDIQTTNTTIKHKKLHTCTEKDTSDTFFYKSNYGYFNAWVKKWLSFRH